MVSMLTFSKIYVPMANYLMFVGTILVTIVYNNTTSLGNAYGVCVILVTFITTCMVTVAAIIVWRLHPIIVFPIFLIFITLDSMYLSSALMKIPVGAWFTVLVAGIMSCILLLWRYGKNHQWAAEATDVVSPSSLVFEGKDGAMRLKLAEGDKELRTLNGLGVFFDKAGHLAPPVYTHFLQKFEAQHEVTVFFHLRQTCLPHVAGDERYSVQRIPRVKNTFRVVVRHGYMDFGVFGDADEFGPVLVGQLQAFLEAEGRGGVERGVLERAYRKQVVYIFGKEQLHPAAAGSWGRRMLLKMYVWMRENTRSKPAEFGVRIDRLVEVGFVKEI